MDFYGIEMKGGFRVEVVDQLPEFTNEDSGRLLYVTNEDLFYYGGQAEWKIPGLNVVASILEVMEGLDDEKYISPLKFAMMKASGTDVLDGIDNNKFITALALRFLKASILESSQGINDTKYVTPAGLREWTQKNPGVPTGAIFYFPTNSPPDGYLEANGGAISRATYSNLFSVIGTQYGGGNGATTFNLPNLRGVFVRGVDNGRGLDPGRTLGSYQEDIFGSHRHAATIANSLWGASGGYGNYKADHYEINNKNTCPNPSYPTQYAGGSETRPKNIALLPCIKF